MVHGWRSRAGRASWSGGIALPSGLHPFDRQLRSGVHLRSGLGGGVCTTLRSLSVHLRSQLVSFRSQAGTFFSCTKKRFFVLPQAGRLGVDSRLGASVSSRFCRSCLARRGFDQRRRRSSAPAPDIGRYGSGGDGSVGGQSGVGRNLRRRQVSHLRVGSGGLRHLQFGEIVLLEFEFGVQTASFFLRGDASGFDL